MGDLIASHPQGAGKAYAPRHPVCGIEVEFEVFCDGIRTTPEELFGSIRTLVDDGSVPWSGKAVSLPQGGVAYFDRGVIEVVSPPVELAPHAVEMAVECIWQQVRWMRNCLDKWTERHAKRVVLGGFSAHYNFSFDPSLRRPGKTLDKLAALLCLFLPFPLLRLATTERSTGIGARPRKTRIEITIDFTADQASMTATAGVIAGIVTTVMTWSSFSVEEIRKRGLPQLKSLTPIAHTSRNGWLAHQTCFERNPFEPGNQALRWATFAHGEKTMIELGAMIFRFFRPAISEFLQVDRLELAEEVINGSRVSPLDRMQGRYDDVRGSDELRSIHWPFQSYAAALLGCMNGDVVQRNGVALRPRTIIDWFTVRFEEVSSGIQIDLHLDDLPPLASRASSRLFPRLHATIREP